VDIERAIEFILQQSAKTEAALQRLADKQERTEATLRRAVALGVRELRNERVRRQKADEELDLKITQLASAQIVSEERLTVVLGKLDRLIDALGPRHNGHPEGPRP
jgi:hypothetical protein